MGWVNLSCFWGCEKLGMLYIDIEILLISKTFLNEKSSFSTLPFLV